MRRSNNFTAMRKHGGGMSRRERISALRFGYSKRVPLLVSTTHPKISLVVFQSPSLASVFLRLAGYLIYPGTEGKISLRARIVSSETLYCWVATPRAAQSR